jgi:hypothetical protein
MSDVDLPQKNEVKCLGMHLHRRLTWAKHIKTKKKDLNQKRSKCIGYSVDDQHYQQKANSSFTK